MELLLTKTVLCWMHDILLIGAEEKAMWREPSLAGLIEQQIVLIFTRRDSPALVHCG